MCRQRAVGGVVVLMLGTSEDHRCAESGRGGTCPPEGWGLRPAGGQGVPWSGLRGGWGSPGRPAREVQACGIGCRQAGLGLRAS